MACAAAAQKFYRLAGIARINAYMFQRRRRVRARSLLNSPRKPYDKCPERVAYVVVRR